MTLESNISRAVFQGNGQAELFPFRFRVWDRGQVRVWVIDPLGKRSDVTAACTFTLDPYGGTVHYRTPLGPLPVGSRLSVQRNMPFIQRVDLVSAGRFDAKVLEEALDVAAAERQQLRDMVEEMGMDAREGEDNPPPDLSDYYTRQEADSAISSAIVAALDAALPVAIDDAVTKAVEALRPDLAAATAEMQTQIALALQSAMSMIEGAAATAQGILDAVIQHSEGVLALADSLHGQMLNVLAITASTELRVIKLELAMSGGHDNTHGQMLNVLAITGKTELRMTKVELAMQDLHPALPATPDTIPDTIPQGGAA